MAEPVKVGVLDTGIDTNHPDLQNRISAYDPGGADDADIVGHGTHVAGNIAAAPDDDVGVAGVCHCELHVWKIFADLPDARTGEFFVDELMYQRALNAARNAGMRSVNLSFGGTERGRTDETLIRLLIDSGCTVIAAMGNDHANPHNPNPTEYPAAYPGVLAVGATDEYNRRAPFSNTGEHIGLSAPGVNIFSTLPVQPSAIRPVHDTEYGAWSGTSMATPYVTAAAALLNARNPGISPDDVAKRLKDTATKLPGMEGRDHTPD